jgi:hypothetical protein
MEFITKIIDIVSRIFNNKSINKYSTKKLRYKKNGISLIDAIFYRFAYSQNETTKQTIVSSINFKNNTEFSRQAFEKKDLSVPVKTYQLFFQEIVKLYNNFANSLKINRLVGIDGTYNLNKNHQICLNMGIYDISNGVPIDISYFGHENRNKEVSAFIDIVKADKKKFKNTIFVCDRLYFNYKLLHFLYSNKFKYVIRSKGNASNLDPTIPLKKSTPNYKTLKTLRKHIRIVKSEATHTKKVCISKRKESPKFATVSFKSDCVLLTNIKKSKEFTDSMILDMYHQRWSIETYFKLLKRNFKFEHLTEDYNTNQQKMYYCEMIISYIMKMIEHDYWKKHKQSEKIIRKRKGRTPQVTANVSINKTNVIKGIFKDLLHDLLNGTLSISNYENFCKTYVVQIKNEKDRLFPRYAKTPFKKWYVKGYSEITKYARIVRAIIKKTTDKLDKNLKVLAKRVVAIDGAVFDTG